MSGADSSKCHGGTSGVRVSVLCRRISYEYIVHDSFCSSQQSAFENAEMCLAKGYLLVWRSSVSLIYIYIYIQYIYIYILHSSCIDGLVREVAM